MLQRAKYNRFRNESVTSVDELLLHGLPMNAKVPAGAPAPAPEPPYASAAEALPHETAEDSGTALCTLINKVSSLKFTNSSGLLGIKGLPSAVKDLAVSKLQGGGGGVGGGGGAGGGSSSSPASSSSLLVATGGISCASATSGHHEPGSMSTGKKGRMDEAQTGGEDWHAGGVGGTGGECAGLVNKPSRGWLHSSDKIAGPGVTYVVK
ncbi:SHC-transforming protein 3, partial [Tachysurus ichikawai]